MATTKWIKTMSNNQLDCDSIQTIASFDCPNPFVFSGNGKVFYSTLWSATSCIARYKYIDNAWTYEKFMVSQSSIAGTKYLPNPTYNYPVATSEDGNTFVIAKEGDPRTTNNRKIIITSYINGELVQVGPEITFTAQSNFNLANPSYFIQRVFISNDGLKIVLITQGGINTLVFSNGSWNLLPASEDILSSYFLGDNETAPVSNMSKNGMYLTLLNLTQNSISVFKFDNQINNWVLFKEISHSSLNGGNGIIYVFESFVSNTGVVLVQNGYFGLSRFEYSVSTGNYEFIFQTNLATRWWNTRCFISDDCNTFICRKGDFDWPKTGLPRQYILMLKWTNENWVKVDFPNSVMPIVTTDENTTGFVLGMSNDGGSFVTTPILTSEQNILNVYYNVPLPTLHLGDIVKIKETDVSFNSANVFVKAPTVALHVANKQYVDMADEEIHELILESATTDTTSTTEYYDLLEQRQTVQSNLATQVENLYQYFFNQSRDGPVPDRT